MCVRVCVCVCARSRARAGEGRNHGIDFLSLGHRNSIVFSYIHENTVIGNSQMLSRSSNDVTLNLTRAEHFRTISPILKFSFPSLSPLGRLVS